ncbi:MAG: hypothetical protein R2867_41795 [Caldilineaceae bacterium]
MSAKVAAARQQLRCIIRAVEPTDGEILYRTPEGKIVVDLASST